MQEYLARYFFYFFESLFEFFWRAFSHAIKIDIALELDATPAENAKLQYHAERITDSPVENPEGITSTKNTCCFSFCFPLFRFRRRSRPCLISRSSAPVFSNRSRAGMWLYIPALITNTTLRTRWRWSVSPTVSRMGSARRSTCRGIISTCCRRASRPSGYRFAARRR